jgi:hypothetical protein
MKLNQVFRRMGLRICASACVALTLILMGCGSLEVNVAVLDPGHVRQEMADETLRKQYRELYEAQPGEIGKRVDRQFEAFSRQVLELAKTVRTTAKKLPAAQQNGINDSAGYLETAVSAGGQYSNDANRNATRLETLAQEARVLGTRLGYANRGPMPPELRQKLMEFQTTERDLRTAQIKDVRETSNSLRNALVATKAAPTPAVSVETELTALQQQTAATLNSVPRSVIQDGSLAATEFAYVVANAPEGLWKPDFNRAFASGTFGNVDVVIRLNSTADFSVKGLLFDPSKVAQVASKVMTQAVLLGAQMAGVPVPTASTGTTSGGDALSKSSAELAAAEATLAKRKAQLLGQQDAMRSLARSLITAATTIKDPANNAAGRKVVSDSVDASLDALKPLLEMQDFN